MRIVCPSCSAEYDVPDSLLTAGRVVRCARCGDEWLPVQAVAAVLEPVPAQAAEPPPVAAEPVETATSEPPRPDDAPGNDTPGNDAPGNDAPPEPASAMERLAMHPARPSSPLALRLAWLASLVALAALVWAAYAWRAEIAAAWPPSARMYAVFGERPASGRPE